MLGASSRPSIPVPLEIGTLVAEIEHRLRPDEIWLFGSRARGDHRSDSDWDLLAVLADDAPAEFDDPVLAWSIVQEAEAPVTLLSTRSTDLKEIWGLPNTLGYDLSREGVRLLVR